MLAAEFPNDNPDLHEGTIWVCLEVTGAPVAERHLRAVPIPVPIAIAPVVVEPIPPPVIEADVHPVIATLAEPILPSTVELEIAVEPVADVEPPAARESGIFMTFSALKEEEEDVDEEGEILVEELGPLEDAILEAAVVIEPVMEPAMEPVMEPVVAATVEVEAFVEPEPIVLSTIAPPPPDDAWVGFVSTLVDIAMAHGATAAAAELPSSLDGDAIALAWAGILRGTSEDWDAVGGSMLDEWAAGTLARVTGADVQVLKRELRARGVAAFGLAA
jgi:hypothetical protein